MYFFDIFVIMKKATYNAEFIFGTDTPDAFPKHNMAEIAFCGRSNVGKSSLINSIVRRKNLAHTSSTPGKTQSINFFVVQDKWCLVDMPGFGYAQRGKDFQQKWKKENLSFLANRENIKFVNVLVDSRIAIQEKDLELIEFLENEERNYLIILTKVDKITQAEMLAKKAEYERLTASCRYVIEVLPYSSFTDLGRDQLLAIIKKNI